MQLGESCSLQPFSLHKLLSYRSVLGHLMKSKCLFAQTFMLFLSFGEVVSVFLLFVMVRVNVVQQRSFTRVTARLLLR